MDGHATSPRTLLFLERGERPAGERPSCLPHGSAGCPDVLTVTSRPADEGCAGRSAATAGGERVIVRVGELGGPSPSAGVPARGPPIGPVTTVVAPTDLRGLAATVADCLGRWTARATPSVVCFDAVDDLLAAVPRAAAVRLLGVLVVRARLAGAHAHFHLDAAAHDPGTVDALTTAVDETVDTRRVDGTT